MRKTVLFPEPAVHPVDLPDGTGITSVITMASLDNLGLAVGTPVTAIVKAMNVIVAVPAK